MSLDSFEREACETDNHPLCGWGTKGYTKKTHLSVTIKLFKLIVNSKKER